MPIFSVFCYNKSIIKLRDNVNAYNCDIDDMEIVKWSGVNKI